MPETKPRERPATTQGITERVSTGCGNLYITVNHDEQGICEIFARLGKSGGCSTAQLEALTRLVSLNLRSGVSAEAIIPELREIRCPSPAWNSGGLVYSCADAIARVLEQQSGSKKLMREQ